MLWFVWVGNLGRGKLVDDLSPAQFDLLVKVLSRPSNERDFKHLLTPSKLWEVFYHPKEFILPKVSRLNFKGLRDVRAKERVQNRLLVRTKEASEEMARGDLSDAFPFVALLYPELHYHLGQKDRGRGRGRLFRS